MTVVGRLCDPSGETLRLLPASATSIAGLHAIRCNFALLLVCVVYAMAPFCDNVPSRPGNEVITSHLRCRLTRNTGKLTAQRH